MPRKPRRCCAYPGCPKLAEEKSTYCAEHKKVMDKQYQTYERPTDITKSTAEHGNESVTVMLKLTLSVRCALHMVSQYL